MQSTTTHSHFSARRISRFRQLCLDGRLDVTCAQQRRKCWRLTVSPQWAVKAKHILWGKLRTCTWRQQNNKQVDVLPLNERDSSKNDEWIALQQLCDVVYLHHQCTSRNARTISFTSLQRFYSTDWCSKGIIKELISVSWYIVHVHLRILHGHVYVLHLEQKLINDPQ